MALPSSAGSMFDIGPCSAELQTRTVAAAAVGDDEILVGEHHLVAGAAAGIGVKDVDQGEHIAQAEHQKRRRVQDTHAVGQFRIVMIKPVERRLSAMVLFLQIFQAPDGGATCITPTVPVVRLGRRRALPVHLGGNVTNTTARAVLCA